MYMYVNSLILFCILGNAFKLNNECVYHVKYNSISSAVSSLAIDLIEALCPMIHPGF